MCVIKWKIQIYANRNLHIALPYVEVEFLFKNSLIVKTQRGIKNFCNTFVTRIQKL